MYSSRRQRYIDVVTLSRIGEAYKQVAARQSHVLVHAEIQDWAGPRQLRIRQAKAIPRQQRNREIQPVRQRCR